MKTSQKLIQYGTVFLFCLLLLLLFFRSFVFAKRSASEYAAFFIKHQRETTFLPLITPCSSRKLIKNAEQQQLLNYRSLGIPCEK